MWSMATPVAPARGCSTLLADRGQLPAGEDETAVIEREQQKVFEWARTGERSVRADPVRAQQIAEETDAVVRLKVARPRQSGSRAGGPAT